MIKKTALTIFNFSILFNPAFFALTNHIPPSRALDFSFVSEVLSFNPEIKALKNLPINRFFTEKKLVRATKTKLKFKAQEATLNFGTQNINVTSATKTFTIRGSALQNSVIISATSPFVISKDSVVFKNAIGFSTEELATNQIVYVKFKPTFAGNFSGSIINTSDGADSKYLNLTGKAVDPDSKIAEKQIVASNIVTPNGDGKNDTWVIENIEYYPSNTVKVFDKAGRIVYSKKNYTNDWNGTYNNAPLSQGTYFYVIEFGAGVGTFKGYITIIRD